MPVTRDDLIARLADMRRGLEQARVNLHQAQANYNAQEGAMQFCQKLIAAEPAPDAPNDAGISIEKLFPGATVEASGNGRTN